MRSFRPHPGEEQSARTFGDGEISLRCHLVPWRRLQQRWRFGSSRQPLRRQSPQPCSFVCARPHWDERLRSCHYRIETCEWSLEALVVNTGGIAPPTLSIAISRSKTATCSSLMPATPHADRLRSSRGGIGDTSRPGTPTRKPDQ